MKIYPALNLPNTTGGQINAWLLFVIVILGAIAIIDSRDERYFWTLVAMWLVFARACLLVAMPSAYGFTVISDFFSDSRIKGVSYIISIIIIVANIIDAYGAVDYDRESEDGPNPSSDLTTEDSGQTRP